MSNTILLSHGSGGQMTHDLINDLFVRYFDNDVLSAQTDSAVLNIPPEHLSFTTDSYVIDPVFFPGGDIGKLAVCGTVNDLAVSGAVPKYLSAGFIIEEGFEYEKLERIVKSMAEEAKRAGVHIVTGDTKVVNRGKADKIFINTAGIGILDAKFKHLSYGKDIKPGDKIIINGPIGDHGVSVMAERENLGVKSHLKSDCASLNHIIERVLTSHNDIKLLRDITRGGLATVLCEIMDKDKFGIAIEEEKIPVKEEVNGMCEILGLDPLYIANEGKFLMVAGENEAEAILQTLRNDSLGTEASIIGEVIDSTHGKVLLKTVIGGTRVVDMPAGEQLPRIC